ncbi:unnamed protein product, partial [Rotaria sp. Silwood1]
MERFIVKLAKIQSNIEFLRMCLIYNLIPKFIRFKLANKHFASMPQ